MIIDPFGKIPGGRLAAAALKTLGTIPVANGGTGATTKAKAVQNLGLADSNVKTFAGNSESSYITNVLTYAGSIMKLKNGVVAFNAQWNNGGYGTAIAWQSSDYAKMLILYNESFGVRFYLYTIVNSWEQISVL